MCLHLSAAGLLKQTINRLVCIKRERRGDDVPIKLQLMIRYRTVASFRLQTRAEWDFGILLTENDHIPEDGSTFLVANRNDEKEVRCQSVAFRHEAANAVKLATVVSHQPRVVGGGQTFVR